MNFDFLQQDKKESCYIDSDVSIYSENEFPQPQDAVALGFLITN